MDEISFYPDTMTLHIDEFPNRADYRAAWKDCCQHYCYKHTVDGGWKFWMYADDYETWLNQA